MKYHFKVKSFLLFCFVVVFIISCRKENKNPSWDVDVLLPLVKSTLTINNIIPDSILHSNPDNSLNIVYNTPLYSFNSDTLFKIRDTTLTNSWPYLFSNPTVIQPGGAIINPPIVNNIQNNLGDVQLTNFTLKSGKMLLAISNGIHGLVDFNYKIPSAKNISGNIFDTTVTLPPAIGTAPGMYSGSFDLSGYKFDLTLPGGTNVNTIATSYSASVAPAANGGYTTTLSSGDAVQITNKFIGIVPDYAKGYFGQTTTNIGPSTTNFSLFKHIVDGTIKLQNVNIGLAIENSVGVDARFTIADLSSFNSRTGQSIPLSCATVINSPMNINGATDMNGNVTSSTYSTALTSSNSNIIPFVENLPDKISYKMKLEINPLGNVYGNNNFIYKDKLMKTELNMSIPLSILANNLTLADTLNFKLDATANNVNNGKLYLFLENGFPFTAEAQLYLLNTNSSIVDSLINTPSVIAAPPLDVNSICIGTQTSKLTMEISVNKMNLLRATKKIVLKIKFNTTGMNFVKIYDYYKMNAKLVGDFNYTVGK